MNAAARPALVFLRGLIRSRFHWNGFPQRFASDFEVIEPELPGNGFLSHEDTPLTIREMMEAVRSQVRLTTTTPVTLVAISMGGMIATEWARTYPDEIRDMHLINTSLANMSLPWERMDAIAFFRLLSCLGQRQKLEKVIYRLTINRHFSAEEESHWLGFAASHPLSWRNIFVQLIAASRYKGPLQAPIEPVFFYNSRGDRLVRPQCTERIARHWERKLITNEIAGHDLPVDDPQWLEAALRRNFARR